MFGILHHDDDDGTHNSNIGKRNLDWLARIRYTLRCRSNRTSFVMHSQLEGIRRLSKQTDQTKQPSHIRVAYKAYAYNQAMPESVSTQSHTHTHTLRHYHRLLSVVEMLTARPHYSQCWSSNGQTYAKIVNAREFVCVRARTRQILIWEMSMFARYQKETCTFQHLLVPFG